MTRDRPARGPGQGRIQILAVFRKEVLQTLNDRRMMFMLIVAPMLQTLVFGFAVNFDVDRIPTAVVDHDRSAAGREHLRRLLADGTLRRTGSFESPEQAERELDQGEAAAAVILPRGLGSDLLAGRPTQVQVLLDGTDPNRATVAASTVARYFGEVSVRRARERLAAQGVSRVPSVNLVPRVFYNPSLRSAVYMVPGVLTLLLLVVTTIVTAMGLAREREMGTLEQVLVTPIRPLYLLVGKMVPFFLTGMFDVLLIVALGTWIFDVPLRGSVSMIALASFLYILSALGVGLFVSTVSRTQQQGFLGGFLFAMPAMLLSGVTTPIRSMPTWLQAVTTLNPLRYYAEVMRAVMLKGAGLAELWPQLGALLVFGVGILGFATLRFRKRVA